MELVARKSKRKNGPWVGEGQELRVANPYYLFFWWKSSRFGYNVDFKSTQGVELKIFFMEFRMATFR